MSYYSIHSIHLLAVLGGRASFVFNRNNFTRHRAARAVLGDVRPINNIMTSSMVIAREGGEKNGCYYSALAVKSPR